ncbi:MAG: DUF58 domain-containing protein [Acidobacteria bacterium]|nr:DUF58 domain-containing protein [Acidobacteriota bacterium]
MGQIFSRCATTSRWTIWRRVDWKATARTRRIIVREFSAEDDKRVTVVFDMRMPKPAKQDVASTVD